MTGEGSGGAGDVEALRFWCACDWGAAEHCPASGDEAPLFSSRVKASDGGRNWLEGVGKLSDFGQLSLPQVGETKQVF